MHDIILALCRPDAVRVLERYVYSDKVSGVRHLRLPRTEGRIEVTIPYDGRRDFDARWEEQPLPRGGRAGGGARKRGMARRHVAAAGARPA